MQWMSMNGAIVLPNDDLVAFDESSTRFIVSVVVSIALSFSEVTAAFEIVVPSFSCLRFVGIMQTFAARVAVDLRGRCQ